MLIFCHRNYQTFLSVDYFGFNLGNLFRFYTKHNIIGPVSSTHLPLYNTADASMWYFYAVGKYLDYTGTPEDYAFVQETIYPKLKEIIAAYEHGTDFSIYMEEDGLIHAGSGLDPVSYTHLDVYKRQVLDV